MFETRIGCRSGSRRLGRATPQAVAGVLAVAIVGAVLLVVLSRWGPVGREGAPQGGPESSAEPKAEAVQALGGEGSGAAETDSPSPRASETEGGAREDGTSEESKPARVSGKVRVAGTEEPAPGVKVVLRREEPSTEEGGIADMQARLEGPSVRETDRVGVAGEDGAYRVEGLPAGEYRVFALRGETDFVSIPPVAGRRITIGEDLAPQTVDIEIVLGGVIMGKVYDGDGSPLPGAEIKAPTVDFFKNLFDPDAGFSGIGQAKSGEDGSYRIGGLNLEERYFVMAEKKEKANAISGEVAFEEGTREVEIDFVLLDGSAISGRVRAPEGTVLADAEVQAVKTDESDIFRMAYLPSVKTDAIGAFLFEHLPAGKYRITATKGGREPTSREVECDGESPVAGVEIVLAAAAAPEAGKLSGTVKDDLGTGLEGVALKLSGFTQAKGPSILQTSSKAGGEFVFEGVTAGVYNLEASHEGHAPCLMQGVGESAGPIDIVLQRVGRVSGRVIAAVDGQGVGGAVVRFYPVGNGVERLTRVMAGQLGDSGLTAKAADDGTFILENVAPGKARIRGEAAGFAPGYSGELDLRPGEEVVDLEVELSSGGIIRGLVVTPDGKGVLDATVRMAEVTGSAWEHSMQEMLAGLMPGGGGKTIKTDADGGFELEHLPEGTLELTASHPDFAPSAAVRMTLARDESREGVQLPLRRPGKIEVTARKQKEPISGLMVQVLGAGPMKMSNTDAEGKAIVEGLAPAEYLVQTIDIASMMSGKGMGLRQKAITLGEGETAELEFVFGEGAKVRGKFHGEIPKPMGMVTLRREGGPAPEEQIPTDFSASIRAAKYNVGSGFISPDGSYEIADVPDGEFILEVPRMPTDLSRMAQMTPEELKPIYRATVKVENGKDVEHEIRPASGK